MGTLRDYRVGGKSKEVQDKRREMLCYELIDFSVLKAQMGSALVLTEMKQLLNTSFH